MIETAYGLNHAFTAPHRIATKVGSDILDNGGTAIEAMVAAAATIAVVSLKLSLQPVIQDFALNYRLKQKTKDWIQLVHVLV